MSERILPKHFERQSVAGECGLAVLAIIAKFHGKMLSLSELRRQHPASSRGMGAKGLLRVADLLGFSVRPLRCEVEHLKQLQLPAILHWDLNHYVVLGAVSARRGSAVFEIADPANDLLRLSAIEISKHFTGVAFEIWPAPDFKQRPAERPLRLSQLWSKTQGFMRTLGRLLALSVLLQVIALAMPLQMQLTIDSVIPSQSTDLALILLLGFFALLLINSATSLLRGLLVVEIGSTLSFQTSVNLARHVLLLPVSFFSGRHLGDIVSRFDSLQPISDLLSKGIVAAIVDAALSAATLALLFVYAPPLALLSMISVGLLIFCKWAMFRSARFLNANLLANQAVENTVFMENIRGVEAIKAFCQEENRVRVWQSKRAETIGSTIKLGKFSLIFEVLEAFLAGLDVVVFVFLAGWMVISGAMSLGMVFAAQAFRQNFSGAASRFLSQYVSYRLLDVHLNRLADLVYSTPEEQPKPAATSSLAEIQLSVVLKGVSFRYPGDDKIVLKNIDLEFGSSHTTVIVGGSGAGKTTLAKLICGLLPAGGGQFTVNGLAITKFGVRAYRRYLGIVSQDDKLFAGSILENVTFFDSDAELSWAQECCSLACIASDIEAMPMKYETMVGDMGSSLSGGQRQRLLLARALYKKPQMLIVDEGTANLDIYTERNISENLRSLKIPRLIVAHRPETILSGDRIFLLSGGVLQDITLSAREIYGQLVTTT